MLAKNISIGDRIEIELKRNEGNGKIYVSQVENVLEEDRILMHVPISYGKLVKLPVNSEYTFLFFTLAGLTAFDGKVMKYKKEGKFSLMIVKLTSAGEKIQRRDFFRFSCILPMKFSLIASEGVLLNNFNSLENEEMYQGIVRDLGGGGVKFLTNFNMDERDHVKCIIKLDDDYIVILAEVLQKYYFPKSNYRYQYRVGFIGILPHQQEKIVQFIFNEQKRVLQKKFT